MAKTVTTRLDEEHVERIDRIAARRGVDRSAFLRHLLIEGLRENMIRDSLEDYQQGKMTLWEVAENCGLSLWEAIEEARRRHIRLPYDLRELEKDLEQPHRKPRL